MFCIPWYLTRSTPVVARTPVPGELGTGSLRRLWHMLPGFEYMVAWFNDPGYQWLHPGCVGLSTPLFARAWLASGQCGWGYCYFHMISMICAIPIALGSDKLGSRKKILIVAGLMITLGLVFYQSLTVL